MKAAALFIAGTLLVSPARAHAFLNEASPTAGSTIRQAPARVDLHFTEELEGAFSSLSVTDSQGHDVTAGKAVMTGVDMQVPLKSLAPGDYLVRWHAVSVDTHRTRGHYSFTVAP